MKKLILLFVLLGICGLTQGAALPDNMYFKAMKDEMARSMKKLRRKGVPSPLFIIYKLENERTAPTVSASLGETYSVDQRDDQLNAQVVVTIGTNQQDSLGYKHDSYAAKYEYAPEYYYNIAKSYDGIRQALWGITDSGYLIATELYQQKEAYKRTKQEENEKVKLPDFMPSKQANYVEGIKPIATYDTEQLQMWVRQLSAQGKAYTFLEQFIVAIKPIQRDTYYLNNLGGFYQISQPAVYICFFAKLRNTNGYKQDYQNAFWLSSLEEGTYEKLVQKVTDFLKELEQLQKAVKPEPYLGPVLLRPQAAGQFVYNLLAENLQNLQPLLSSFGEVDESAGKMRTPGQRVMSPEITVYDEPYKRFVSGPMGEMPVGGFMPVDDEGVAAKKLTLVENGRLKQLPRTSRPFEDKTPSNGHARLTSQSFPRERLTNVQVQPQVALQDSELEKKLLDRCRELGLDYGYILYDFPTSNDGVVLRAQRVYTTGDRREMVYGLRLANLTTRALRDIMAAGDQPQISWVDSESSANLSSQSVFSPALLIDEIEFVPTDKKPDRKPFIPRP